MNGPRMDHSASTSSSRTNNRDQQLQVQPNFPSPGLRKSPTSEAHLRWNTAETPYTGPSDGESSPGPEITALSTHSTVAASPSSVASGTSPSSTPQRANVTLRRRESASGSSVARVEEGGGTGIANVAAQTEKRLNVGDRLRMLGRRMRPQKTRMSSPKVSTTDVLRRADDDRVLNAIPTTSAVKLRPSMPFREETLEQGTAEYTARSNGKLRAAAHQRPSDGTLSTVLETEEYNTFKAQSASQPPLNSTSVGSFQTSRPANLNEDISITGSSRASDNLTTHNSVSSGNVAPEPITLAARIQALVRALPSPFTTPNLTTSVTSLNTSVASKDPPIPSSSHALAPSSSLVTQSPIQFPSSPFPTSPLPLSPLIFPSSPLPSSSASIYGAYPPSISLDVERDASGRPIPPPFSSPLPPQERMLLEELLSSPAVMNGELPNSLEDKVSSSRQDEITPTANTGPSEQYPREAKGKERASYANFDVPKATSRPTRSIWSVLESMGTNFALGRSDQPVSSPPSPGPAPASPLFATSSGTTNVNAQTSTSEMEESMFSDIGSSVMIYSPLIPSGAQDLPELAEVVPVDTLTHSYSSHPGENTSPGASAPVSAVGNVGTAAAPASPNGAEHTNASEESATSWIPSAVHQWSFVQAISSWSGSSASDGPPQTAHAPSRPGGNMGAAPTQAVRKAWVPSTTKISVQAMWWGYRLYLPPPIMAILSDRTLEASKRAALITTALTWFFSNLPVTTFPPPLQPAALLLQRIAPFLGYIGAFISWSWGVIEGYNVGYGVTLTATWLLPVALIPGTWYKDEFPTSPSAISQPVPLPYIPQIPHSPASSSRVTSSDRSSESPAHSGMIQTRAGLVPARVTEFLPLPTPAATATAAASNAPNSPAPSSSSSLSMPTTVSPTPLPSSPAISQSTASTLVTPRASGRVALAASPVSQPTPTPLPYIPMPPSPVSSSMYSYAHSPRHLDQIPFTPQSMTISIPSALPSPISTPSSRYQTPLLSSPAPTDSSQYHTSFSSSSTPTPSRYHTPLPRSPTATSSSLYQTPLSSPSRAPSSPRLPSSPRSAICSSSEATPTQQSTPLPSSPPSKASDQRSQMTRASNKHLTTPSLTLTSQASGSRSRQHPSSRVTTPAPVVSSIPVTSNSHSRRGSAQRSSRTPNHSVAQITPTPPIETDAIPYPIPVGSPLEQHLLSGPLMSPVPLPDVDLPSSTPDPVTDVACASSAPETSQSSSSSAPVPLYAYADKEERARERDRDKARIRERARAVFRRTNSGQSDSRKSKA